MAAKEPEGVNGLDLLTLMREEMVRVVWGRLSGAVRAAGREILKRPREMARVLRETADYLEKYADEKEGKG